MASWDPKADDFELARNTFVTMFWRMSILDGTATWLLEHGYRVVAFDASAWKSARDMYDDVAARLEFPRYFGRNLNAFNDCMGDVASCEYGWRPFRYRACDRPQGL